MISKTKLSFPECRDNSFVVRMVVFYDTVLCFSIDNMKTKKHTI